MIHADFNPHPMLIDRNNTRPQRKVAIYIRVSTSEQKIDGYGLEVQKSRLLQYVEDQKSFNLVAKESWVFCDVHTGSDVNRPELQRMLKLVREGRFDAVLVWKIDRLSRSLKHLLTIFDEFEKYGTSFVSIQENIDFTGPIGKLIFQIFGAIAQFERELIKGRTRMGKIASAEMGNYTGSFIPYGYKPVANTGGKGKKLEIVSKEKKWVQEIYNWHIFEDMGFGQIADRMKELKIPKGSHVMKRTRNTPWNEKTVREILVNPIYRGEFVANRTDEQGDLLSEDQWTVVAIPRCVTELTFQQAIEVRKNRNGMEKSTDYLLSGKLFDMTLEKPKRFSGCKRFKGGFSYRRKQFKNKQGKHHSVFEVPGKQLEEYVWQKISLAMKDPETFIEYYLSREYADPNKAEGLEQQLETNRAEQTKIRSIEIPRIEGAYERGIYDEDKLQEKLIGKNTELTKLEESMTELEDELRMMSATKAEAEKLRAASAQIKYKLDNLDRAQKKVLCCLFVDRIEMYRDRRREKDPWDVHAEIFFRFNPDRVPVPQNKGRTQKELVEAYEGTSGPKNEHPGGVGGGGYSMFRFAIRLKSSRQAVSIQEPVPSVPRTAA